MKVGMKVGDFMSAKCLYRLAFWIGMLILTGEFLQVVESRYPVLPRLRQVWGLLLPTDVS